MQCAVYTLDVLEKNYDCGDTHFFSSFFSKLGKIFKENNSRYNFSQI